LIFHFGILSILLILSFIRAKFAIQPLVLAHDVTGEFQQRAEGLGVVGC
jgi:hypothetical protein